MTCGKRPTAQFVFGRCQLPKGHAGWCRYEDRTVRVEWDAAAYPPQLPHPLPSEP